MLRFIILSIALFLSHTLQSQTQDNWCASECNMAGDEKKNSMQVFSYIQQSQEIANANSLTTRSNGIIDRNTQISDKMIHFPIRIVIVDNDIMQLDLMKDKARQAIKKLSTSYEPANMLFTVDTIEVLKSQVYLEDLYVDGYARYNSFSFEHDRDDVITLYVFEHGKEFCDISPDRVSCGRVGGFSYILSQTTNNIVISNFDLSDQKIVAHEFGHFFGLYHPFEETQFGKDQFSSDECHLVGDRICDTPPDPGAVFEVYVNYSNCEMIGLKNENGNYYRPLLNNYMSYYKPCYLTKYEFTPGQIEVVRIAAQSNIRSIFQGDVPANYQVKTEEKEEVAEKKKRKCFFKRNRS